MTYELGEIDFVHQPPLNKRFLQCSLSSFYSLIKGDELPVKTTSFQYWSKSINNYVNSESLAEEIPYWEEQINALSNINKVLDREKILEKESKVVIHWAKDDTQKLLKKCQQAYRR